MSWVFCVLEVLGGFGGFGVFRGVVRVSCFWVSFFYLCVLVFWCFLGSVLFVFSVLVVLCIVFFFVFI